jgi:hypothetical protein
MTMAATLGFGILVSTIANPALLSVAQASGTYTLNFNNSELAPSQAILGGSLITAPTPPARYGYTFNGWATSPTGLVINFPYSPASAHNYRGIWNSETTYFAGESVTYDGLEYFVLDNFAQITGYQPFYDTIWSVYTPEAVNLFGIWHLDIPTLNSAAITGTPRVGQTLSALLTTSGIIDNRNFQWQRSEKQNSEFKNIAGAINSSYLLTSKDSEKYLRVVVSVANATGVTNPVTTAITSRVVENSRDSYESRSSNSSRDR